jgi:hypothetical protein
LFSGGNDRQVFFYDLESLRPIEAQFRFHAGPVSVVKFVDKYNVGVATSADSMALLSYNPPAELEHIQVGLSKVFDVSIIETNIIIASSQRGHALINRIKAESSPAFQKRERPTAAPPAKASPVRPAVQMKVVSPVMPPAKIEAEKVASPPKKMARGESPATSGGECTIYSAFRKDRGPFMTEMNERLAKVTRVGDVIKGHGLPTALEQSLGKLDMGVELLSMLAEKPQVIKLEHGVLILQIAAKLIAGNPDVAVASIENQLKVFGPLVYATRMTTIQAVGVDIALEERRAKADSFVAVLKVLQPSLQKIASARTKLSKKAANILDEWKKLLR